jgi:RimJ/RimL family protein N-acetyltransferase
MLRILGPDLYLATLERKDCLQIWRDYEYDFKNASEQFNIGYSEEKAGEWFEEIQKLQGNTNIRLGIFLNDGTVIGDIALQDINRGNRCCSIGIGMTKIEYRSKRYGKQAIALILNYGFNRLGMERITASTLENNTGAIKSLEHSGFVLEGRERKAVYLNGNKLDRLNYAILIEEYMG